MMQKNLVPLDGILRVLYTSSNEDHRLPLSYLERGQELRHPMRTNYFYPLLLKAYSPNTCQNWTDDERLRLYRLLDRLAIPIESLTYSRLLQQSFHQYYQNNFTPLLEMLSQNNLQSILDRMCRLLLIDIRQKTLPLNTTQQIAPYFRLNMHRRQEEFSRYLFSIMTEYVLNCSTLSSIHFSCKIVVQIKQMPINLKQSINSSIRYPKTCPLRFRH